MEKYLNSTIKSVITEFPKVGTILNDYEIGCVTCSVGTCLLKDIIEIHNVPKHIEAEMMKKIEAVIEGNDTAAEEAMEDLNMLTPREIIYAEPIHRLVAEHTLIKRLLALIPDVCDSVNADLESNREVILKSVEFIRQFADKFHHAKEEDILFAYAKGNTDIISVMLEDHKKGRYYVKSVLLGLETGDASFITYSLKHYRELLSEHIKKEDEILYPWIEKGMSAAQIDELQVKFDETDLKFGSDFYDKWDNFVHSLEKKA
ncbi:MAG: Hemerythrin cation binding domain protein [Clostridia bacterium]|jgi:hemerythrin-like domain-containing protein|nr:Hemerythrin cation binding domain protein [Clostridia bacterium]